jgi:hypothetical protein
VGWRVSGRFAEEYATNLQAGGLPVDAEKGPPIGRPVLCSALIKDRRKATDFRTVSP